MSSFGTQLLGRKCFGTQTFSARHCLSELLMEPDHQAKNLPRRTMLWIFLIACVGSIFYNLYSSPSSSDYPSAPCLIEFILSSPMIRAIASAYPRLIVMVHQMLFVLIKHVSFYSCNVVTPLSFVYSYCIIPYAIRIDERQGRYDAARVKRDVFYQDK